MTCMNIEDEKREALEAWAQRLASIVNPAACRQGHQAAEAAAMIELVLHLHRRAVGHDQDRRARHLAVDADQIERYDHDGRQTSPRTQSLRSRIETAATAHILRSAFESQTPGHKARIKQLTALRDRAEALRDDIIDALAPTFTIEGDAGAYHRMMPTGCDPLGTHDRAIAKVVSVIDASIAAQRPQPTANTSKPGRDRFWNEMLAIWTGIGGEETGVDAANFLIAISKPVFRQGARCRRAQDDGQHAPV